MSRDLQRHYIADEIHEQPDITPERRREIMDMALRFMDECCGQPRTRVTYGPDSAGTTVENERCEVCGGVREFVHFQTWHPFSQEPKA